MRRKIVLLAILLAVTAVFLGFSSSGAYYSDSVTSVGNTFTAGTWDVPFPIIRIGNQVWMQDNLDIGTLINASIDQTNNSIIEKYCYDNDQNNCDIYGGLYQWNETMQYSTSESTAGICPTGFHIPSDYEWKTLELFLGMSQEQADAENSRGTDQGIQLQVGGTSGFSWVIGGHSVYGSFYGRDSRSWIWTSTQHDANWAWQRGVGTQITRDRDQKIQAFSVRCLMD